MWIQVTTIGDLVDRHKLIVSQTFLSAIALIVVGTAHHPAVLSVE